MLDTLAPMPRPLPDLSLTDWAVLGVVAERPTHGWPVVRALAPDGELGRVWTVTRPLVYRSLGTLEGKGLIEPCGEAPGGRGPHRVVLRATAAGRGALRRWLGMPVEHVRDVRSHLLVKLALLDRAGRSPQDLVAKQLAALAPVFDAVKRPVRHSGFDATIGTWRREQALAVERFLRAQLRRSH
jgi:PadR family transcriptional regulator AphA